MIITSLSVITYVPEHISASQVRVGKKKVSDRSCLETDFHTSDNRLYGGQKQHSNLANQIEISLMGCRGAGQRDLPPLSLTYYLDQFSGGRSFLTASLMRLIVLLYPLSNSLCMVPAQDTIGPRQ